MNSGGGQKRSNTYINWTERDEIDNVMMACAYLCKAIDVSPTSNVRFEKINSIQLLCKLATG